MEGKTMREIRSNAQAFLDDLFDRNKHPIVTKRQLTPEEKEANIQAKPLSFIQMFRIHLMDVRRGKIFSFIPDGQLLYPVLDERDGAFTALAGHPKIHITPQNLLYLDFASPPRVLHPETLCSYREFIWSAEEKFMRGILSVSPLWLEGQFPPEPSSEVKPLPAIRRRTAAG
jgi:hypothetical protein